MFNVNTEKQKRILKILHLYWQALVEPVSIHIFYIKIHPMSKIYKFKIKKINHFNCILYLYYIF